MRVLTCLFYDHSITYVALAAFLCVVGSIVTMSLLRRAAASVTFQRMGWVFLSSTCAGAAIWTTHFVAVLGYDAHASIAFDPVFTILSILIAIIGTGAGFGLALASPSRTTTILGGGLVGIAISAMHYTGMIGYRIAGIVSWERGYVVASIALAVAFSIAAMHGLHRWRTGWFRRMPIAFLAAAIVSLHFTGMAAFTVVPLSVAVGEYNAVALETMALSVAIVGLVVIGTGISSYLIDDRMRVSSDERLMQMAFHDALTGLLNRRALTDEMDDAFARHTWFKLLLIDLDHFKAVNDTFGHATGDRLLIAVAERLIRIVGTDAHAYRIGGDELAVTVFRDRETAMQTAADIVMALKEPFAIGDQSIVTGCSIGLCAFENADDAETLMQRADVALYEAKRRGRGQVFRYAPGMLEAATDRSRLESALMTAIEKEQFHLVYQPIIELKSDRLVGYEALIRWDNPVRGLVAPADFIPLAEENGCIVPIGKWVLEEACRAAAHWPSDLYVAVNVSAMQFKSALFLSHVTGALAMSGLGAHRLEVELTETAMVDDGKQAAHALKALRLLGIKIAMDDFGTGFSSLSHLRDLPLDRIKIDRSFVASARTDRNSMAVLRAITQLGRDMEILTLGEGVETEDQLTILKTVGCDAAQGYFLGKPMRIPVEDHALPARSRATA